MNLFLQSNVVAFQNVFCFNLLPTLGVPTLFCFFPLLYISDRFIGVFCDAYKCP